MGTTSDRAIRRLDHGFPGLEGQPVGAENWCHLGMRGDDGWFRPVP